MIKRPVAILAAIAAICCAAPAQQGHVHTSREGAKLLPPPRSDDVWHFVVFGDRTGGKPEGIEVLKQAVVDTNLLDPDLVMTVGDLVQGYNRTPKWMKQMREFRATMDGLKRPWYPVAGNHDIYWRGQGRPVGEHEGSYEKHFGPLWYWFAHKTAAFIVLYTDEGDPKTGAKGFRAKRHTQFSATQLEWLAQTLEKARDKEHVFLFMHHPRWIPERYPEENNWNDVHDLLKKAGNVRAVFAGHIHRMHYAGPRDGIEYVALATTGGALGGRTDVRSGYLHHFNVVTVRRQGISQAAVPVGAVLDPRVMTTKLQDELDLLVEMRPPPVERPLFFKHDGSTASTYALKLENPTTRPVEFNLITDDGGAMLTASPDHQHLALQPGESRLVRFAYERPAIDLRHLFDMPVIRVQMDYLTETARISLPERSWPLEARLRASPAQLGKARRNGALQLDGRGACVAALPEDVRVPQGPFTVEGWLHATRFKKRQPFLAKTELSEFAIFMSHGQPQFDVHLKPDGPKARARYVSARAEKPLLKRNRWHHVAGVFDGKEVRLYVDGRLAASKAGSGTRTENDLRFFVGADPNKHDRPVDTLEGLIDDVRISTVARYKGESFVPRARLKSDSRTLLLLPFDRNMGPFTINAAGRFHAQRIGKARCVAATAPGTDE